MLLLEIQCMKFFFTYVNMDENVHALSDWESKGDYTDSLIYLIYISDKQEKAERQTFTAEKVRVTAWYHYDKSPGRT